MSSSNKFEINATIRSDKGKGASRRLRRKEVVPGVLYGAGKEPVSLSFIHKELTKSLNAEAFYSRILSLKIDNESEKVILKDVQRHPYKPRILHVDFQRIRSDQVLHMNIPLHFIGEDKAPGVIKDGGVISHIMSDVEIACLPDHLPEYIEVDVSEMQLNDIIHLSNLKLPEGVQIVALIHEDDKPVVSLHMPRIEEVPVVAETPAPVEVPAIKQKAEGEEENAPPAPGAKK